MVRGYRGELDLNNAQQTLCRKHAGAARWAYNYGLRRKQEAYKAGQKTPTAIDLHREINALKPSEPWMREVSKCAFQEALRDLDAAFKHFFRKCRLKKGGAWKGSCGYPRAQKPEEGHRWCPLHREHSGVCGCHPIASFGNAPTQRARLFPSGWQDQQRHHP
ncbi:hypothetical protein KSX_78840 [Ktedonospora formicarum]|uniref:Transposase putative helix-turn-helix domain-containing protein n=2 Tax=Ktedonospora formicarum TaxID=2778364 RepID=A0A8J3MX83_9CHLR|nr:hypothetical protein KSX_78840 [Ktedonospora formicarum]